MMKYLMRLLVDVAPSVRPRGLRGRTRDLKLPSGVEHLERGRRMLHLIVKTIDLSRVRPLFRVS